MSKHIETINLISGGKSTPGLVSLRANAGADLAIGERAAVNDAKTFEHVDFIYFRRYTDGRSSQIAAYIIDNTTHRLDEKALAELHWKVWLYGLAPLIYVAWKSRVDILSCVRGPDFWKSENEEYRYVPAKTHEIDALKIAGEISDNLWKFTISPLADGTFWEDPDNRTLADHTKGAHQELIQAIVEADEELEGEKNPILRRLLILLVLIKYLEDRQVFPGEGWFGSYRKGARGFFDILAGGEPDEVLRLLAKLEEKFNGDIFSLPAEGRQKITKQTLHRFAELVEAKTLSRQRYLWKRFSFAHLPVEVISHLYQRFVNSGHGAVYTPPFLAGLLLDHAMPYDKLAGDERILDPSCGSGVFLVGAFKRLVNVWRSHHGWRKPDVQTLKRILKRSIYGVELDANAVHLTAFSLSLAVCDALQPAVIWSELKFDPLHESNLHEADFFTLCDDTQQCKPSLPTGGFDIVVGNPPFESKLSAAGKIIDKLAKQRDRKRGSLPDKQVAYLFMEQTLNLLRPNGRLCLIQPAGILYNRNAHAFLAALHRKFQVDVILDFSSVRKLYDAADPKTVAISVQARTPHEDHLIDHLTFRRTHSTNERICFEIDHYDHHRVSQAQVEKDPLVWRINLLGGGRLHDISQRLRRMRTLQQFLAQQKGWDYGEGFIAGSGELKAPFLTDQKYLPTEALTLSGIDESKIGIVTEKKFESPRHKMRFSPPLLLIKELDTLPIAFWDKSFLAYRHRIVGIHAPQHDIGKLEELYNYLLNNKAFCRFSSVLHNTESAKATANRKQDIDLLPYPENHDQYAFVFWEQVLCDDLLRYMTEYIRLGQNAILLKKEATYDDVKVYSELFIRMLGSVYENLNASVPIFLDGLICQAFYFGERPNLTWLKKGVEAELRKLIFHEEQYKDLRTVRVLRFYSHNVLFIVKPDRLRYWIRSTAIRDADETIVELRTQGY